jgi:hypothetical protein
VVDGHDQCDPRHPWLILAAAVRGVPAVRPVKIRFRLPCGGEFSNKTSRQSRFLFEKSGDAIRSFDLIASLAAADFGLE